VQLREIHARLTPADHQTHRPYGFEVPDRCTALRLHVRYAPKLASIAESAHLVEHAVARQRIELLHRGIALQLTDAWAASSAESVRERRIANLLTISVDDAHGAYRGAAHRQPADMQLFITRAAASPGFVAGRLPAGPWRLTLSVHTLVSSAVELSIQVAAETATSAPSAERSSR
jgi:hypothetical protein